MSRELKVSGIEWIGEIPSKWGLKKISSVYRLRSEKVSDKDFMPLSVTKNGIVPQLETVAKTDAGDNRKLVRVGDFVINSRSDRRGSCGISSYDGSVSLISTVLEPMSDICNPYYAYVFKTELFADEFYKWGTGIVDDLWTTNWSRMKNIYIPFTEYRVQQNIAEYLDQKCAEIDSIIDNTKSSIVEYKAFKQSLITDAVTKGIIPNVTMKDSGVDWIGKIPVHWETTKIKYIFRITKEIANELGHEILSVTQSGLKIKDISTNEGQISADYSKYQLVQIGDFVMNHMDLLTGWVDCSEYNGVTSPDYRVFKLVNEENQCKKFYTYVFQICYMNEIFYGLGQGVSNLGRWRLQTDKFNNFKLPVLSLQEQQCIANFLDEKCSEIDNLISQKQQLISELENYKKNLIYECVTGKKDVGITEHTLIKTNIYPNFPALLTTNKKRFAQAVLASKVIDTAHTSQFGRVKLEKMLYTLETHIGFDFDTAYERQIAGPLDGSIYQCENMISQKNSWFTIKKSKYGVKYSPTQEMYKYKIYFKKYFTNYESEIERIINIFKPISTDDAEVYATLYASWNDFIIAGKTFKDEDIVNDVLNNWHDSKERFSKDIWVAALEQMRKLKLVPKGYGKKTKKK